MQLQQRFKDEIKANGDTSSLTNKILKFDSNNKLTAVYPEINGIYSQIIVDAPRNSDVTCTQGSTVLRVPEENGRWTFILPSSGSWTCTSTSVITGTRSEVVVVSEVKQYYVSLGYSGPVSTNLNSNSWATIQEVARNSEGSSYWSLGDRKSIALRGQWGNAPFQIDSIDVFIIGFDHNSSIEGIGITFMLGKVDYNNVETQVAAYDAYYSSGSTTDWSASLSGSAIGGWASSNLRVSLLNGPTNSFKSIIENDLSSVIRSTIKYTDNSGYIGAARQNATSTLDFIFLLSPYELYGDYQPQSYMRFVNPDELNYQQQYDYFENDTSKFNFKGINVLGAVDSTKAIDWSRSPAISNLGTSGTYSTQWCTFGSYKEYVNGSYCVSPVFVVG